MINQECDFCQEFSGLTTWLDKNLRDAGISRRILVRKNGVISLVGVGPLSEGYTLILPTDHYYSVGSLPDSLLKEVLEQKEKIVGAIRSKFGSVICYEHGAVSAEHRGGACIDHAHLNIIPGCIGFRDLIARDYEEVPINGLRDLSRFSSQQLPYLYVEDVNGLQYAYKIPYQIPSQYLRQVWARALKRSEEWDWALYGNYELMHETYNLLKDVFD